MGLAETLECRDAGRRHHLNLANLEQPTLLAEVAEGLGHGDPRNAGHFSHLTVGEVHDFEWHCAAVFGRGAETFCEPEQQMEQSCLNRPDTGQLQEHSHLLDLKRATAVVFGLIWVPFVNGSLRESPQFNTVLVEQLWDCDLSGTPDAQGEVIGGASTCGGSEMATSHAPTEING